jgi:hypothetical protein
LNVGDPLAFVFEKLDLNGCRYYCSKAVVVQWPVCFIGLSNGTTAYLDEHGRDGLLPNVFSKYIKIQNAFYATIVTGFVVAVPALF